MANQNYLLFEEYCNLPGREEGSDVGLVSHGANGNTWGNGAAGILIVSQDLQDVFLLKRAPRVLDPNVWGIPGGARKQTPNGLESAIVAAINESQEELGNLPKGKIRTEPYVYQKPGTTFTYETFILEIDPFDEKNYKPELNWENVDYGWFRRDSLQEITLHPGLKEVLDNYKFE